MKRDKMPVTTQNGEAKALRKTASFEASQEQRALLKILALGQQEVDAGKLQPVADVVARLRARRTAS